MKRLSRLEFCIVLAVALLLAAGPLFAVDPKQATGALFTASDGDGRVHLFWFPPAGKWPAGGWRVDDGAGKVLFDRVAPDANTPGISAEDAQSLRDAVQLLLGAKDPDEVNLAFALAGARSFSDTAFAHALGLSRTLENVPPGKRNYRVVGLDASGRDTGVTLTGPAVDSAVATPLPPPPQRLLVQTLRTGVALFWRPAPADRLLPVLAYRIERVASDGQRNLTPKPIVLGATWDAAGRAFSDDQPAVEQEVTYEVSAIDLFGRASMPLTAKAFVPDLSALEPPLTVTAQTSGDRATVEWSHNVSPNTAGYIVERSLLAQGPFEAITAEALPAAATSFADAALRGGTAYYYRVRAMNPRGELGSPSKTVKAVPASAARVPRPTGLAADAGSTRVRLTWTAVDFPVAGYFVERRMEASAPWSRLNETVTPEPLYDDRYHFDSAATLFYRVLAVGYDNQESEVSAVVEVKLADQVPPARPNLLEVNADQGTVLLRFAPGLPAADTQFFLVVRGGSPEDPGLVIGDPVPASVQSFEDTHVLAGNSYWYRMIALDAAGNRSVPTAAVAVRVAGNALARPPAPTTQFVAQPFPHVKLSFAPPPPGHTVLVQRRASPDGAWMTLLGPLTAAEAMDANPPAAPALWYRVIVQAANDARSQPSAPAQVVSEAPSAPAK